MQLQVPPDLRRNAGGCSLRSGTPSQQHSGRPRGTGRASAPTRPATQGVLLFGPSPLSRKPAPVKVETLRCRTPTSLALALWGVVTVSAQVSVHGATQPGRDPYRLVNGPKGRQVVPSNHRHWHRHPPFGPFRNKEAARIRTTADNLESFLQFLLGSILSEAKRPPGSREHLEHDNPLQTPCFHVARGLGDDPGSSGLLNGRRRTLRLKVVRKANSISGH